MIIDEVVGVEEGDDLTKQQPRVDELAEERQWEEGTFFSAPALEPFANVCTAVRYTSRKPHPTRNPISIARGVFQLCRTLATPRLQPRPW